MKIRVLQFRRIHKDQQFPKERINEWEKYKMWQYKLEFNAYIFTTLQALPPVLIS